MILRGIDLKKVRHSKGYNGSRNPFYKSKAWRDYRKFYLMNHPLCVMCEAKGLSVEATVVDHVIPITQGGSVWDCRNHQGLCKHHNAVKTALDNPNEGWV